MLPNEELVPVKRITPQSSWSWISIDATGKKTVLDVDKYVIMHRVQIHARDLRILDPNLFYPSAILGRERAIVLNLEVGTFCHSSAFGFFTAFSIDSCLFWSDAAYQGDYHCRRGQNHFLLACSQM
jgi:hypothetical protein